MSVKVIEQVLDTGDPKDGGWLIYQYGPGEDLQIFAWEPVGDDEFGEEFVTYDIGDIDDAEGLDWIDAKDIARSTGVDLQEFQEALESEDDVKRAFAIAEIARVHGWAELTAGYSELATDWELQERFGTKYFDAPDERDLEQEAESIMDDMANWYTASSMSLNEDFSQMDEEEWDMSAPIIVEATFGDHTAYDGWVLDENPVPSDYEVVEELSGSWPSSVEAELDIEHVADRLSQQEGVSKERAEYIIRNKWDVFRHGEIMWRSGSGEITTWAKPL